MLLQLRSYNKYNVLERFSRLPVPRISVLGSLWGATGEIEAAHTAAHATIFKDSRVEGSVASTRHLRPGVAAVHATWEMTGQTEPDGRPSGPRRGILLLILTEEEDGWCIRVAQNTDIVPGVFAPPGRD